jgi:hypothetical protein
MREGVAGLLREKTRKPGLPPLPAALADRVVALALTKPTRRDDALCRKSDYAAWPSFAASKPVPGHAAIRHNRALRGR